MTQLGAGEQRDPVTVAFSADELAVPAAEHRDQWDVVSRLPEVWTDDVARLSRRGRAVLDRGEGECRRVGIGKKRYLVADRSSREEVDFPARSGVHHHPEQIAAR